MVFVKASYDLGALVDGLRIEMDLLVGADNVFVGIDRDGSYARATPCRL